MKLKKTNNSMQFSETISVDDATIQAVQEDSEDKLDLLYDIIRQQKEKVVTLLNSYDHYVDTHGQVYDFEIEDDSIYIDSNGEGGFRVGFKVYYYFGCDDMNTDYDQEMEMTIVTDFRRREIEIIGEEQKKREPDEY
jgi:hypothetical protein